MKTPAEVLEDVIENVNVENAVLQALDTAGYVIVPKEPTISACFDASRKVLKELPEGVNTSPYAAKAVYREMTAKP